MTKAADGSVSRSQYTWMYASNAVALIVGVLVYRLASSRFGTDGFAEYALARRGTNLLAPALMLGVGVALPRQLAMLTTQDRSETGRTFFAAHVLVTLACTVLGAIGLALPGVFADLVLGDRRLGAMVPAFLLYLTGLSWHSVLWAFFRGTFRFRAASCLDICNLGVAPVVAFVVAGKSPAAVFAFVGGVNAFTSLVAGLRWLRPDFGRLRAMAGELLGFGLPRVPGDFAQGALLALPSLAIARASGLAEAGNIAFGNTMLALAGTAVAPFSAILLPRTARLIATGRMHELRKSVVATTGLSLAVTCLGLVVVELGMPFIVRLYLGADYLVAVGNLRILAVCVVPFVAYSTLRSVLDAGYRKAENARNLYVALGAMALGSAVAVLAGGGTTAVVLVAAASHWLLGVLTIRKTVALFRHPEAANGVGRATADPLRVMSVIPGVPDGSSMIFARRESMSLRAIGINVLDFHIAERVQLRGVVREWARLGREIRAFDPDIVHAHYGTTTALLCLLAAGGRPVVVTFRGSDLNPSEAVSALRSLAGQAMSQVAALFADQVICVSAQLRSRLWWRRGAAVVLPSGVDVEQFRCRDRGQARAELGLSDELPLVAFNCGRDPWVKNLDLAEAAIAKARETIPGLQFIVMRGDWAPDRVPLLLAAADCLLVTSRHEGSPNIVREAMACGLPIVSVDVGDVVMRLAGVPHCEVHRAEAAALGEAVARLASLRARTPGREIALSYSLESTARQLVGVFETVVGTAGAQQGGEP